MVFVAVWIRHGSEYRLVESELLVTPILKPCFKNVLNYIAFYDSLRYLLTFGLGGGLKTAEEVDDLLS